MKYLLTFLSFSLLFSQELEVEGDLKVTGNLEAATIDSLNQVIDGLQAQIDTIHADNQLETRMFELPEIYFTNAMEYNLDLSEITGYDLEFAYLKFGKVISVIMPNNIPDIQIDLGTSFVNDGGNTFWRNWGVQIYNNGSVNYIESGMAIGIFDGTNLNRLKFWNADGSIILQLAITAQFPD